jgi:hypothetical protein
MIQIESFDTQRLDNPGIHGNEYQHGTLFDYEAREYLLKKYNHSCVYCGASDVPLQLNHLIPKSSGGTDRVSNLVTACRKCVTRRGDKPLADWVKDKTKLASIKASIKRPMLDVAAMNAIKNKLVEVFKTNFPEVSVDVHGASLSKFNRHNLGIPQKNNALLAACVGPVDELTGWQVPILHVKSTGRGQYKRTTLDRFGFARGHLMRQKFVHGFKTGDVVKADIPKGVYKGSWQGRCVVRASGSFTIQTPGKLIGHASYKNCTIVQRSDGYSYSFLKFSGDER